jgi:hypothetical protein
MHRKKFNENSLVTVLDPPYSPDLAPPDLWVFGHIKPSLAGRVFHDVNEFREAVIDLLNEIQLSELPLIFHHWIELVK